MEKTPNLIFSIKEISVRVKKKNCDFVTSCKIVSKNLKI